MGLFAVRAVAGPSRRCMWWAADSSTRAFLKDFPVPAGTQLLIYRNVSGPFDAHNFAGAAEDLKSAGHYQALVDEARTNGRNAEG